VSGARGFKAENGNAILADGTSSADSIWLAADSINLSSVLYFFIPSSNELDTLPSTDTTFKRHRFIYNYFPEGIA